MEIDLVREKLLVLECDYERARSAFRRLLVNSFPSGLAVSVLSARLPGRLVDGIVQDVEMDHGIRVALEDGGVQVCHWTCVHPRPVAC